ncbi:MAG: carbohydrate-binding family 9-like protein [Armatimonadota bacterium]
MRYLAWVLIATGCLLAAPLWAAPAEKPKAEEIPCRRAADVITIDGKYDEVTWQQAVAIPMIVPITNAVPVSGASAKVAWDDRYLYVAFETKDQDIWSTYTERDALTCTEDCFEIFLKPLADKYGYANLEINALGTVMDALPLSKIGGGDNSHRWKDWTCRGIQVGISIQGTLNDLTDKDTGWTMEVAVPFDQLLAIGGGQPRAGDLWSVLLAHYDHSVYLPGGVEADSIASLSVFSFGKTDEWRQLRFVNETK